jgi:hypothetical protein
VQEQAIVYLLAGERQRAGIARADATPRRCAVAGGAQQGGPCHFESKIVACDPSTGLVDAKHTLKSQVVSVTRFAWCDVWAAAIALGASVTAACNTRPQLSDPSGMADGIRYGIALRSHHCNVRWRQGRLNSTLDGTQRAPHAEV